MLTKKTLLGVVFYSLVFPICSLLYGQATGSLSGTVSDATGSVIPGATVTVTSQGTSFSRVAKTDDTGHFLVPLLPIGIYTIRVEYQGFQAAEQKDLRLQVEENREVDFTIAPAAVQQKVEVSATPVAVDTTTASLGQVITSQQVAQLPLNGRNFVQLATLMPGVTKETSNDSFFNGGGSSETSFRGSYSLSVGGSRANSTDWLLDGVDNNELTGGAIAILPSIDAIQEFKVLTFNYAAQYGTRGGPTVLVTIKSGSNQYHGTVFEFLRNTKLDARSFFQPEREQFNQNQFGGALGGPIKKDKTFFFADYQEKRLRQGLPFSAQVPTLPMRQGDFTEAFVGSQIFNPFSTRTDANGQLVRDPFMCDTGGNPLPAIAGSGLQPAGTPCNKIPANMINSAAQGLLSFYPAPNVPGRLVGNFLSRPAKKLDDQQFDFRLDHSVSSNDSIYARFSYDQADQFLPSAFPAGNPSGFASTQNLAAHARNAALSETHILSGTSVNKVTLGYNRIFNFITSFGSGSSEGTKLGILNSNLGGDISSGIPDTTIGGGFWGVGDRGFAPFQGGTNVYFIADSFDMIRGNHDIKIGGEARWNQMNVKTAAFQDGWQVFSNLFTSGVANGQLDASTGSDFASFLLGLPFLMIHDQVFTGPTTGRRWQLYRPYFQDDWRVTPNLTLNLGLAYALVTPITENHDRQANFDFQTGNFLVAGVNAGDRVGVDTDKSAFEPRIGFAWSPRGDRKTSIRGGYGMYHDSSWNQGAQGLWENPTFFGESVVFSFSVIPFTPGVFGGTRPISAPPPGQPSLASGDVGFPPLTQLSDPSQALFQGLFSQNRNFKQGRIQQWNLNIQRELPGQVLLTAGYVGSRSAHILTSSFNLNTSGPLFGIGQQPTPYPLFGTITGILDNGLARYDSFQVKAETKSSKYGLYTLIGYTYARSWDNGFADGLGTPTGVAYFPLPVPQNSDKGFSQIQQNHILTASYVYDLPFGKGKAYGTNLQGVANQLVANWQVNGIVRATSGFPLFLTTVNNSGTSVSAQFSGNRPDRICNGRLDNPTVEKFFDASCFVDPPGGFLGNSTRSPLFGPGLVNFDFSVFKTFPLPFREGTSLEFRTEFFNIFNHPQFAQPDQSLTSPGFGVITSTVNNPRLIQFALKLSF